MEVASLPNFAEGGVFADLTPWIERDKVDLDDFASGMLRRMPIKGSSTASR